MCDAITAVSSSHFSSAYFSYVLLYTFIRFIRLFSRLASPPRTFSERPEFGTAGRTGVLNPGEPTLTVIAGLGLPPKDRGGRDSGTSYLYY